MAKEAEVLVIGGGPAGLAAAIALRQQGLEVALADGATPPIDKACGEGLLPQTLVSLGELGVGLGPCEGMRMQGLRFLEGRTVVEAKFPGMAGLGVRRIVLHQKLVERAQELGVALLWNTPVNGLCTGGAIVGGRKMRAGWIVGADGIRSRVRRWAGLDSGSPRQIRFAHQRHYRLEPWSEFVEIYWRGNLQIYVTPLGSSEICVIFLSREPGMRFEEALREFPEMAARLSGAGLSSPPRGAVTAMCRLQRVHRGNVALTGDASGSIDAIAGEGLGLSFRQAIALASAVKRGELERYQVAHERLSRRPLLLSRGLLFLDKNPRLRKKFFGKLERDSGVLARLLALHAGENSLAETMATTARLGWQFLTT